jgi:hypothetical protein
MPVSELLVIDIEDLKGFSDLANEQIANMIDIKKAFDVYRYQLMFSFFM